MKSIKKRTRVKKRILLLVKLGLLEDGYKKVTNNIFVKDDKDIVIIKFMVSTTNSHEVETLSLKEETYNFLKGKDISVLLFKKNCFRSLNYDYYTFTVNSLIDTFSYRCKKQNLKRYKIIGNNINNIDYICQIKVS